MAQPAAPCCSSREWGQGLQGEGGGKEGQVQVEVVQGSTCSSGGARAEGAPRAGPCTCPSSLVS